MPNSKSYRPRTGEIRNDSFTQFIRLALLCALILMITIICILCYVRDVDDMNKPSFIPSTTENNYGVYNHFFYKKYNSSKTSTLTTGNPPSNSEISNPVVNVFSVTDEYPTSDEDNIYDDIDNMKDKNGNTGIIEATTEETMNETKFVSSITDNEIMTITKATNGHITTKMPRLFSYKNQSTSSMDIVIGVNPTSNKTTYSTRESGINSISDTTKSLSPQNMTVISINISSTASTMATSDVTDLAAPASLPVTKLVPTCSASPPTCQTIECKKSASKVLLLMNHEVDPCEDFHSFACSGAKNNMVKMDYSYENHDLMEIDIMELNKDKPYVGQYQKYYESCMAYDKSLSKEKLSNILKNIHEENITAVSKESKLADLIADLLLFGPFRSTSRMLPMFDVIMAIGPDGTYIPVITVPLQSSPVLEAGNGDFYEKYCQTETEKNAKSKENVDDIRKDYENCMKNHTLYETILHKAMLSLNLFVDLPEYNRTQKINKIITTVMWDVIDEIGVFSELDRTAYNEKPSDSFYWSLNDITVHYPMVNWSRLFTKLFGDNPFLFRHIKITNGQLVKRILNFYKNREYEETKSCVLAMLAHDLYVDYLESTVLLSECDRKPFCTRLVTNLMKQVTSKIYINKFNTTEIQEKEKFMTKIFLKTKKIMKEAIDNTTWLKDGDKDIVLSKLNDIELISNSSAIFESEIDVRNRTMKQNMIDCFITNTIKLLNLNRIQMYEVNGKSYLETEYFWTYYTTPLESLPFSILEFNKIVIPFRFLAKTIPNLVHKKQNYEVYSQLSYRISYELASYFSPRNFSNLIKNKNEIYQNFVDVNLIDPYISKIMNSMSLLFNRYNIQNTLNSRFNDDAAIYLAVETYKKYKSTSTLDLQLPYINYTIPQLFYLSLAQQFCVVEESRIKLAINLFESNKLQNYFRLNSMVMNSNDFSQVFDCPKGSNMNPSHKIPQFPNIETVTDYDYDTLV